MPLLTDSGNKVADEFGIAYTVAEELQQVYQQLGLNVDEYNDDGSWQLPMPARYIIDGTKIIRYASVSPDYMVRPDPSETIEALEKILK